MENMKAQATKNLKNISLFPDFLFPFVSLQILHIEYCRNPAGYSSSHNSLPLTSDHMGFLNCFCIIAHFF